MVPAYPAERARYVMAETGVRLAEAFLTSGVYLQALGFSILWFLTRLIVIRQTHATH